MPLFVAVIQFCLYLCFFLGPCLFYASNLKLLRNSYIVHHDGTWELTCASDDNKFITNCSESGTWESAGCVFGKILKLYSFT